MTNIYNSYSDFLDREDIDDNGVSPEFAAEHPDFVELNLTNKSCWDCSGCYRCSRCSGCSGCSDCYLEINAEEEKADSGPPPVPIIPNIHKAVYAASSHPGSLAMENVHTCANTHCRAGWVITLAGEAGKKLEEFFNWELAAMKIYDASAPGFKINPARFYDSNADALADMKKLAEV